MDTNLPAHEPDTPALAASEFDVADPSTAKLHPLWPSQIDLEKGMRDEGATAYAAVVDKARRKGHMARLEPVRHLLLDWVPKVSEHVRLWVRAYAQQRGPKPIALPLIKDADPDLLATIALRTVLDRITARATNITPLCIEIGRFVEHEQRMRAWEQHDRLSEKSRRKLAKELAAEGIEVPEDLLRRGSWRTLQDKLTREFASATHRRIVNSLMFNAALEENQQHGVEGGLDWAPWSVEQHFRVGSTLLDALTRGTGWFTLENDPNYVWKPGSKKGPALALLPRPEMLQWLSEALDREQLSQPVYKPTLMPPKRWESTRGGGYWTPYARTPRLIRFKASQVDQKEGAADEYEALDMPEVYSALAFVQETGWAINTPVFHAAQICYDRGIKVKHMVSTAEISDIIEPEDIAENADARKIWRKAQAAVYRARYEQATKMWGLERTLTLAEEFADKPTFHFPHMLDFRGRMYPIPSGLQPQGNDLARGLLRFDTGLPVTEENGGAGWIAVQLASMWGHDKWDFDQRIAWVEKHNALWTRIAADPIAYREDGPEGHGWSGCDKPFQALAAIIDWAGFLREGYGYHSCLPIQVDGTCNGIQHLAAMTRDEVAGLYVNLVPGTEPQDIYRFVAEKLQAKLDDIGLQRTDKGAIARWWIETFRGAVPRSATKRQVMVLPYGGTLEAFRKYVGEWLKEYGPEQHKVEYTPLRFARISFLASLLWETVGENVTGAVKVMKWLQECAKAACVGNQPIYWKTPSGFVVRHFYGKVKTKRIDVLLDGQRIELSLAATTDQLSVEDQLRGIAPNFVHSLDAAALTMCANKCNAAGISHFTAVHDAYGTHAANMNAMGYFLREAFVEVHRRDVLEEFRQACAHTIATTLLAEDPEMDFLAAHERAMDKLPAPLERGSLDLEGVLDSPYFFA